MKRSLSPFLALFLLVGTLFSLAACEIYVDDPYDPYNPYNPGGGSGDRQRANVISGEWQGDFGMYYTAIHPISGKAVTFEAAYSYLLVQNDYAGARRGVGKQIDFYRTGPYEYQYYLFYWEVRNGVLYLTYPQDSNLNVAIYDYYLSNSIFTGRVGNSGFRFRLTSLRYNNWGAFSGNYMFGNYNNWTWGNGYTQKRSLESASATPDAASLHIVRGHRPAAAESR